MSIGGNYLSFDNGDGTFDIVGVPIFAEIPAGVRRNKRPIDASWMRSAVARNRARAAEGYLPPIHVHHHEPGVQPEFAGKLELAGVSTITYEGRRMPATIANMRGVPAAVFERIKRGELPYRSVEIHDWDKEEIDSLALMDTEVPFFRMELLSIGKILKRQPVRMSAAERPAIAVQTDDERCMVALFNLGGHVMSIDDAKILEALKAGPVTRESLSALGVQFMDEDKKDEKKDEKMMAPNTAPGGEAEPKKFEMEADAAGSMLKLMRAIATKLGVMMDEDKKDTDRKPDLAPVEGMRAGQDMIKLSARLAALEDKDSAREKSDAVSRRIEGARKQLAGYTLTAPTLERIAKFAAMGDEAVREFVAEYKQSVPQAPPESMEEFEGMLSGTAADDTLIKFAASHPGPKSMEWAKQQARAHAAHVASTGSEITLSDWLETNAKFPGGNLRHDAFMKARASE